MGILRGDNNNNSVVIYLADSNISKIIDSLLVNSGIIGTRSNLSLLIIVLLLFLTIF